MTIGSGFWKQLMESKQQLSLKKIREVIRTDRPDPCIAIDTLLMIIQAYKSCWSKKAYAGTITSFEPIVKDTIDRCLGLETLFKNSGMRTIWCLDGDRGDTKLATGRRREEGDCKRNNIFQMYCSIVAIKTIQGANDLTAFKRRYAFIEENIPSDFPRDKLLDARVDEMENRLFTDFKNTGFMPNGLAEMVVAAMKAKSSGGVIFMCVPEISEGEKLASALTQTGAAQAVYTTDGDAVILGARYIIKEISSSSKEKSVGEYHLFSYARIVRSIDMNHEQLLMLAILLGNDFNIKVPNDGIATCKKHIKSDTFDIIEHNVRNLGCLNITTCLAELSVSKREFDIVMEHLNRMSESE